MDYTKIPQELKALNQWVCTWDSSKVPMKAFEWKAASPSAPETWSSFEQAQAAVEAGYYDDVGFVFADNGIVGIDIDTGFEDGLMTPLCADIMQHCRSYTEKSRSGRGVHIFLRGMLPFHGKNNRKGVETYRAKRFFIMTGNVLIFPDIAENQAAIDYVVKTYFTETEKAGEKSPLVQRIYSPLYRKPMNGTIFLRPEYPEIPSGGQKSFPNLAGGSNAQHRLHQSANLHRTVLCESDAMQASPAGQGAANHLRQRDPLSEVTTIRSACRFRH